MADNGLVLCYLVVQGYIESVDVSRLELPRRDLILKEQVDLSESSSCWLGQSEIVVNENEEASPSPEKPSEIPPIPGGRVNHIRRLQY